MKKNDRAPQGRFEVVVSGSGGQGIILGGKLLAETAAVFEDRQTAMVPCYGPEVRGGGSTAEIVIDSMPIDYPRILRPNILIAMSQGAMDKYGPLLKPDGLIIVNNTLVKCVHDSLQNVFAAPFTAIAIKAMKTPVVANMIALGAFSAITHLIEAEDLKLTLKKYVPLKVLDLDCQAVDQGVKIAMKRNFFWNAKAL